MKRISLLATLVLIGCLGDAPRDNPLESANGFTLSGQVFTIYSPRTPLDSVSIFLETVNVWTMTDAQGNFNFRGLQPGNYRLIYGGQHFNRDSIEITLLKNTHLTLFLDQLPYFTKIELKTHHQARWFPVEDAYFLEVFIKATDPDGIGDLNRVYMEIPAIQFLDTLTAGANPGEFFDYLSLSQLKINYLDELIGKECYFRVEDDAGFSRRSPAKFITRIIQQTPVLIAPVGLATITSDTIHFQWQKNYLNFNFHYKLEIFQINNGVISIVKIIENIASTESRLNFVHRLPSGDYLWRIYLVDEFGNSSSSKEGAFQIP